MARVLAVATAAFIAAGAALPAASAAPRVDHVLVALGTAGDQPYTTREVEQVAQRAQAFIRRSSFGRETVDFSITPWIRAFPTTPGCGGWSEQSLDALVAPLRQAAASAGYATGAYSRTMYTIAGEHCGFFGITWGTQVLLTSEPTPYLMVHELGHTFGLAHAAASSCPVTCGVNTPGDRYSPMGVGLVDFSVYEKSVLGWVGPQLHARATGLYTIASAASMTSRPQALVVGTRFGQWWFEYRTRPRPGVLARFIALDDLENAAPPFAPSARLILDPVHRGRPWVARHETYSADGTFTLRVMRTRRSSAVLRLAWTGRR
jgi:hypothetical protein